MGIGETNVQADIQEALNEALQGIEFPTVERAESSPIPTVLIAGVALLLGVILIGGSR